MVPVVNGSATYWCVKQWQRGHCQEFWSFKKPFNKRCININTTSDLHEATLRPVSQTLSEVLNLTWIRSRLSASICFFHYPEDSLIPWKWHQLKSKDTKWEKKKRILGLWRGTRANHNLFSERVKQHQADVQRLHCRDTAQHKTFRMDKIFQVPQANWMQDSIWIRSWKSLYSFD